MAVPPPELPRPTVGFVYVNDVIVGTSVTVNVPLYPPTATPAITMESPTWKLCGVVMLIVTVFPDSVAPGGVALAAAIVLPATVPPERIGRRDRRATTRDARAGDPITEARDAGISA